MILTLIRAIQSWQMNSSRLYVVLVKHNVFYYTCGFLFSLANLFTSMLLQVMMLAILATHMHLRLWQMNQHAYRSDALARISISDV
ncbi:hypothetical protein BD769DRAFT_1475074 [Suillus cothurnatus]|nr:hypothetical protein BD769DRAFT_1475074 [Suillus cothurnatus]